MATAAREDLLAAGLAVFDRDGFEGATVAAIRTRARTSNGSFFHFFGSKKELAGTLFLEVLQRYHAAVLAAIDTPCGARLGIDRLIRAHLDWVVNNRREARFLFEISRSEWIEAVRDAQQAQNSRLSEGVERWRAPLIASGELLPMAPTLVLQPDHRSGADLLPRLAIGPRPWRSEASGRHSDCLRDPRAGRAASHSRHRRHAMTEDRD